MAYITIKNIIILYHKQCEVATIINTDTIVMVEPFTFDLKEGFKLGDKRNRCSGSRIAFANGESIYVLKDPYTFFKQAHPEGEKLIYFKQEDII